MIHTLLLLVVCSYGLVCCADATLSDVAPAPKAIKMQGQARSMAKKQVSYEATKQQRRVPIRKPQTRPAKTYTMKAKTRTTQTKATTKRTPAVRYTPATTQQLRGAQQQAQQSASDRMNLARIAHGVTIYADHKSTPAMQANAAADMLLRINQIKTPQGQAQVQTLLKRYNLTTKTLEQEAQSGKALARTLASGSINAEDEKKLTPYHKAIAKKHVAATSQNVTTAHRKK